jgi:uncharacterized protein (DUF58 family)
MVREMEEAPHADTHVLVDLDSRCAAGPPGASSVDELVRIAGSLAHAELRRGRRVALVLCGATPVRVVISGLAGDWEAALDALTVAQVAERACTGDVLRRCETAVVLVSGRSPSVFGDELVRRDVAVVAVDTPTYAGAPRSQADPSLLRLAARGVPVAIVRSGDALEPVLSRPREHARA